jgi:hypothetical protein
MIKASKNTGSQSTHDSVGREQVLRNNIGIPDGKVSDAAGEENRVALRCAVPDAVREIVRVEHALNNVVAENVGDLRRVLEGARVLGGEPGGDGSVRRREAAWVERGRERCG